MISPCNPSCLSRRDSSPTAQNDIHFFNEPGGALVVRQDSSAQYPSILQVVDCLIDLVKLVTMGHQVIPFKFAVPEPTNEDWKIAARTAIHPAHPGTTSEAA